MMTTETEALEAAERCWIRRIYGRCVSCEGYIEAARRLTVLAPTDTERG